MVNGKLPNANRVINFDSAGYSSGTVSTLHEYLAALWMNIRNDQNRVINFDSAGYSSGTVSTLHKYLAALRMNIRNDQKECKACFAYTRTN